MAEGNVASLAVCFSTRVNMGRRIPQRQKSQLSDCERLCVVMCERVCSVQGMKYKTDIFLFEFVFY